MKIQNKKLAVIGVVIIVIGLIGPLSQGAWQMFLLLTVLGLFCLFQSRRPPKVKRANKNAPFEFPEYDEAGHRRLAIKETYLSGITHEHFGSDPQAAIPGLKPGEQVFLQTDPNNEYDKNAVWVSTRFGTYIGWIPSGSNADLFQRLTNGETVYARLKKKDFIGADEETAAEDELLQAPLGCVIEIATYAKELINKNN
ncbi:HIRAN domain-containing protein [Anaerotruncus rubiinfantis]|uniref:HIRAN domain-containing protein n=1 Tax=Anaerotruncus rubiinfantis TaxID=1720200 RepID=UPI000833444B|nr:HIRAN domain-containing protein [Anaerotruncus rubiinfantis]